MCSTQSGTHSGPYQSEDSQPPQDAYRLVEQGKRFSESVLWQLQQEYYSLPIEDWESYVPYEATNSPALARAFAHCAAAYLQDQLEAKRLSLSKPVYIIEIGAGSGRYAYYFIRQLDQLLGQVGLSKIKWRYVMTDINSSSIDSWMNSSQLGAWVRRGRLDFARYDAIRDSSLGLRQSGISITAGSLNNPLIVTGNYILDTIPHDAFRVEQGQLFETLPNLVHPSRKNRKMDSGLLAQVGLQLEHRPVKGDYYGSAVLDRVLQDHLEQIKRGTFSLPVAGFRCMKALRAFSPSGVCFLFGDKGLTEPAAWEGREELDLVNHGSISTLVNFFSIRSYIDHLGGVSFLSTPRFPEFVTAIFVLGNSEEELTRTDQAFKYFHEDFGPCDLLLLLYPAENDYIHLTGGQLLAMLRASGWDPAFFVRIKEAFIEKLLKMPEFTRPRLEELVARIVDNYFEYPGVADLFFEMGGFLLQVDQYRHAIRCFDRSRPENRQIANFNKGLCLLLEGRACQATTLFRSYVRSNPDDPEGHRWLKEAIECQDGA